MHAEFPAPPKAVERWDLTHPGRYLWKGLVTQTGEGYVELRYVEFRDPKDVAEAKAALPEKWKTLPPGIHVDSVEPVSLGGGAGEKAHLRVDASSSTNGAPFPLVEQTQWVWQGGRLFWMDCATPVEKAANCDRFLASFTIEASPPGRSGGELTASSWTTQGRGRKR
jgi:hypothetical protein